MTQVLVVSGDPVLKENILGVLHQNGLGAIVATDCHEGLSRVDNDNIDVVIIDNMPGDVGSREDCIKISHKPDLHVIMLGTSPESEVQARAGELGFDLYLKKPVTPQELLMHIKALMRKPVTEGKAAAAPGTAQGELPASQAYSSAQTFSIQSSALQPHKPQSLNTTNTIPFENQAKGTPPLPVPVEPGQQKGQPEASADDAGAGILEDARIIKLVEAMINGKLSDITAEIDFNTQLGFTYPSVDNLLDTSDQETLNILENLTAGGILIRKPYDRFYIDPDHNFQLVPTERCPKCDSGDIVKGQLVEHFACGYVGLDRDFRQGSHYICPKCHRDMRLIGTDYRNIGIHYRCQNCNEVFTIPLIKWRDLKTRKIWNTEELHELEVYDYSFRPDKRGWLEFQLKPKMQLVEYLRSRGYEVQELAQMTGRSGAVHTIDVLAIRDDILTRINLGIGLLVASTGELEVGLEALFKYDTRTYDIGINYKVVIAIPKLGPEAINFANRQMIRYFEAKTLASVVTNITSLPGMPVNSQISAEESATSNAHREARALLVRFLRNREYEVYEGALLTGKSGVGHVFDIIARRDDRIIIPAMAIGIAATGNMKPVELDEVSRFDAAAFDCGIRNKVFIGIPGISQPARQFARQQRIDVFEEKDLNNIA